MHLFQVLRERFTHMERSKFLTFRISDHKKKVVLFSAPVRNQLDKCLSHMYGVSIKKTTLKRRKTLGPGENSEEEQISVYNGLDFEINPNRNLLSLTRAEILKKFLSHF